MHGPGVSAPCNIHSEAAAPGQLYGDARTAQTLAEPVPVGGKPCKGNFPSTRCRGLGAAFFCKPLVLGFSLQKPFHLLTAASAFPGLQGLEDCCLREARASGSGEVLESVLGNEAWVTQTGLLLPPWKADGSNGCDLLKPLPALSLLLVHPQERAGSLCLLFALHLLLPIGPRPGEVLRDKRLLLPGL